MGGRPDHVRLDDDGRIAEVRVFIRPLTGIGAFGARVSPPLAARRGLVRSSPARALSVPLRGILAAADSIGSALFRPPP